MKNSRVFGHAESEQLESLVDRYGIARILQHLADIAMEKSDHIAQTWQDRGLAMAWSRVSNRIATCAEKVDGLID